MRLGDWISKNSKLELKLIVDWFFGTYVNIEFSNRFWDEKVEHSYNQTLLDFNQQTSVRLSLKLFEVGEKQSSIDTANWESPSSSLYNRKIEVDIVFNGIKHARWRFPLNSFYTAK